METDCIAENKRLMNYKDGINKATAGREVSYCQEIILKKVRACGFERETWPLKKNHERLSELTAVVNAVQRYIAHLYKLQGTAVDAAQRVYGAVQRPVPAFEFIYVQPHLVHFPSSPNDVVKAHGFIPVKKMFTCHYKAFSKALVQWKEHPPPKQATWKVFSEVHQRVFKFSSLRTRMFSTGEYCYRFIRLVVWLSCLSNFRFSILVMYSGLIMQTLHM